MQYRAPVLLAVGVEGAWGVAICALALPLLTAVRGPGGLPIDSLTQALAVSRGERRPLPGGMAPRAPGADLHGWPPTGTACGS